MGRRKQVDNLEFGTDSFLDVITNMVGIMVILIVIAGMKVSRAPVVLSTLASSKARQSASEETASAAMAQPAPAEPSKPPEKTVAKPPGPRVIEPSVELKRYARQLEAELARFDADQRRVRAQLTKTEEKEREIDDRRNKLIRLMAVENNRLEKSKRDFGRVHGTLNETAATLAELKHAIEEAENAKPPVKQIRHQLNPVSKLIEGKEIHFRLIDNRVSHVPIEDLIERLKPQIEDNKKRLLRKGGYRGEIGPVGGYLMSYVVEAQTLSAVDEIRNGGNMVRINLSQWEIAPEPDLLTETADEALKKGSRFIQVLRSSSPDATLTFWVYPDSFELYRRLTQFAHDEGYTVAGRPLPKGVPISGSPNGSRSAGQ